MNESDIPVQSARSILVATLLALFFSAVILVVAVLPAEYNIDPTGLGKSLGLTQLSGAEANETEIIEPDKVVSGEKQGFRGDRNQIVVPPMQGIEYKLQLAQYGKLKYEWQSVGGPLYFDFHGEPQGDTSGFFESYSIGTSSSMSGTLTTPFEGSHGWYWRNDSPRPITVTLVTQGKYTVLGIK